MLQTLPEDLKKDLTSSLYRLPTGVYVSESIGHLADIAKNGFESGRIYSTAANIGALL